MSAPSAKALFRATKPRPEPGAGLFGHADLPRQEPPDQGRDPLDYDPTPAEVTAAVLSVEIDHIRRWGNVIWETCVGGGHVAGELCRWGFDVIGSDIVDRGWPGTHVQSFFDHDARRAGIEFTNPPYSEINASNGHGRWFWHGLKLGLKYRALLLNADWCAARINGMDRLFREHPPSIEYLCCWKIDFRGGGNPPQRNSWFVWDQNRPPIAPNMWPRCRLYRDGTHRDQGELI